MSSSLSSDPESNLWDFFIEVGYVPPNSPRSFGEALFFATEVARIPDKFGNERRVEINGVPIFGSYFDDYEDYELYGIINDVDTIYPDDEFEYDKIDIISMSYDN